MGAADYFVEMAMRVKGARTKSRYRRERRPLANLWSFSVFWCDRIGWPWNSRECKTINAECLATELLRDRIATLRVRHAVSHRFVMFGAGGVGFRSAFEPVRALLVYESWNLAEILQ
jgi:hypothetical protein